MTRRARGFTLLELIVVVAIFAVISVMAYGGLSSVLNSRTRIAAAIERTTALQKGYLRLRNDFQQLRARSSRDAYGASQPALLVRPDDAVEFTRGGWRNPLSQPRSNLERVAYFRDDQKRLVRQSWRVLDRAQASEPVTLPVLDQVEEIHWRFLDDQLQWQDHWPPQGLSPQSAPATQSPPPPRAVELTLRLTDIGEVRFLFSATNVPLQKTTPAPGAGGTIPPGVTPGTPIPGNG
jgi:general secretion pathway protein J